jgi:hypothetical protein
MSDEENPRIMRRHISTPLDAQQIGGLSGAETQITVNLFLEIT